MKNNIYQNTINQGEDEHLKMVQWINGHKEEDFPFMIIKGEEYDRFHNSDDKDDEMDMKIAESNNFYNKFKEITGIHLLNEDNFVSMKYIGSNDINLIVRANGMNQRFVIGV